ncbi:MAG: acetamidase [Dehalococcoidia bacterium]|nr:acetamidase [Dehalococcoidia bacterium]MSQ34471.1 acetamidase [Dehalococcoidia bacterium]
MQHITPPPTKKLAWVIGPYQEPIATVNPGETFQVSTLDAFGNKIESAKADLKKVITLPYVNPCTGPIYVENAEPGDTLSVRIENIAITRDYAVSCIIPEFGGLCGTVFTRVLNEPLDQRILIQRITKQGIIHDPRLKIPPIPVEPFYGTIGTSPAVEAISTLSPGFHGGNMDAADVCPGNTVYLPVNVKGALLFIGDGHAAQGDAEVCGVAAEVPTTGTLTVDLIKRKAVGTPRIENSEFLMSVGSARPMEDAARIAFYDLVTWLAADYGFDRMAAYQLCSQVARVRVANMVDILYTIVAKFPKRYLIKR